MRHTLVNKIKTKSADKDSEKVFVFLVKGRGKIGTKLLSPGWKQHQQNAYTWAGGSVRKGAHFV